MANAKLYDKTGAVFSFDHEHNGVLYVRPMVKVVMQVNYGDDFYEEEDFEPAGYIVARSEDELFYAPPVEALNADIKAKTDELEALKAEAKKAINELMSERSADEYRLAEAKRQLDRWMQTHKGMIDLGKLLDGKILYPLSVDETSYHGGRSIPRIPKMKDIRGLRVEGGDFEKGKEWSARSWMSDGYNTDFQFFDTDEERAAVIQSEFDATCRRFREKPDFTIDIYTTMNLNYGTLLKWVETHPALSIPEDIKAMKSANDAALVEQRKAALAAELASIEASA